MLSGILLIALPTAIVGHQFQDVPRWEGHGQTRQPACHHQASGVDSDALLLLPAVLLRLASRFLSRTRVADPAASVAGRVTFSRSFARVHRTVELVSRETIRDLRSDPVRVTAEVYRGMLDEQEKMKNTLRNTFGAPRAAPELLRSCPLLERWCFEGS